MPTEDVRMLYAGAVNYADAAQLITSHSSAAGRDGLILPTHTLIGLTIEMLFKAVYLHRGGNPAELKKVKVRHNLKALQELAKGTGYQSAVQGIEQIVDTIGSNYAAHEYRYMKPGGTLQYVRGAGVIEALQSLVDEVAGVVDLPIRPDPA